MPQRSASSLQIEKSTNLTIYPGVKVDHVLLGSSCMSEKGPESCLSAPGRGDGLELAEALLIASSIIAVRPPLSGLGDGACRPRGPSAGRTALRPEALAPPKLMSDGLVLSAKAGDIGESITSAPGDMTASFSSNTCALFSVLLVAPDLVEFALARLPSVGIRVLDEVFLTSIGLAVTFRATIELLLMATGLIICAATWPPCASGEDLAGVPATVLAPDEPPCFTLTMFA